MSGKDRKEELSPRKPVSIKHRLKSIGEVGSRYWSEMLPPRTRRRVAGEVENLEIDPFLRERRKSRRTRTEEMDSQAATVLVPSETNAPRSTHQSVISRARGWRQFIGYRQ